MASRAYRPRSDCQPLAPPSCPACSERRRGARATRRGVGERLRLAVQLRPFIERLAGELRIPTLYVSHEIDEVVRLASDLVLMSEGRIVASGPIEEVSNRFDLRSYAGRLDAGSILRMRVAGHDAETGITRFAFAGGEVLGPRVEMAEGAEVNLRVRSRDVAIALDPPGRTSILNVLPGRVVEVGPNDGPQAATSGGARDGCVTVRCGLGSTGEQHDACIRSV